MQNVLILCGPEGAAEYAASLAARAGGDIGLVNTCCEAAHLKPSGSRIEEERTYGGLPVSAFDEPVAVGAAVAQLAGHAEAVVVDRLDDWAGRLASQLAGNDEAIAAERTSLRSVLKAGMLDLFLLARAPGEAHDPGSELARRILEEVDPLCQVVVQLGQDGPRVLRGELPA